MLSNLKVEAIVVLFTEYALGEMQGLAPFAAVAVVARVNVDMILRVLSLELLQLCIESGRLIANLFNLLFLF